MKHQITYAPTSSVYNIDERNGESEFRTAEPIFFRNPHGKRETYHPYRGFLIVRTTANFTAGPVRKTVVYIFDTDAKQSLHVSNDCSSIKSAEKMIDRIIQAGTFGETR